MAYSEPYPPGGVKAYTPPDQVAVDSLQDASLLYPKGSVTGISSVNKFGRSTNVDLNTDTDIHDGANSGDNVDIWVAPTQARIHQITSTSTDDDGDPAGGGARTIQVYGLATWDSAETSEVLTMDGTSNVATSSYVIIHRMKVLTFGDTAVNVGVITATAATDGTVTAQINIGEGQTQMAIYGVPSTQTAYLTNYYATAIKGAAAVSVAMSLLVNPYPDNQLTNFVVKHTRGLTTAAGNSFQHNFNPYYKIAGPAIIKIQGNASANNVDVSAGFDLILETN